MGTTGREAELLQALGEVLEDGRTRLQACALLAQGIGPVPDGTPWHPAPEHRDRPTAQTAPVAAG